MAVFLTPTETQPGQFPGFERADPVTSSTKDRVHQSAIEVLEGQQPLINNDENSEYWADWDVAAINSQPDSPGSSFHGEEVIDDEPLTVAPSVAPHTATPMPSPRAIQSAKNNVLNQLEKEQRASAAGEGTLVVQRQLPEEKGKDPAIGRASFPEGDVSSGSEDDGPQFFTSEASELQRSASQPPFVTQGNFAGIDINDPRFQQGMSDPATVLQTSGPSRTLSLVPEAGGDKVSVQDPLLGHTEVDFLQKISVLEEKVKLLEGQMSALLGVIERVASTRITPGQGK